MDEVRVVPLNDFGKFFNGLALFNVYDTEDDPISFAADEGFLFVGNKGTKLENLLRMDIDYLKELGWVYDDLYECWVYQLN